MPSSSLWGNLVSPDKSLLENSVNESIDFTILLVIVISASIFFIIFKKRLLKRVK